MPALSVFLAEGELRDMAYNAPMRSGVVIDSRTLLVRGYQESQEEIAQTLGQQCSGDWRVPKPKARSNNMQIDVDTKQGSMIIPPYFISRILKGDALIDALKEYNLPPDIRPAIDARHLRETGVFHLHSLEIRMYDIGYGSVTFQGVIEGLRDLGFEEFRDTAERVGSALDQFRELFLGTFRQVAKAVDPALITFNSLGQKQTQDFWKDVSLNHNLGHLFWVHRLFFVPCNSVADFERGREQCKGLIYSEKPESLQDVSIQKGIAIYPGNGNSAVIYDRSHVSFEALSALTSMVRAQNVFFAAAEDIDHDLFYLSNELDRKKHSRDMELLERQSRIIVEYQSKIAFFKGVYDNFDNNLDPQSLRIWHAIEAAWETHDRFDGLNHKLTLVEKIYDRIRDNLVHLHNKRLSTIMLIFTLISSVSVIIDAVNFTQEGDLQFPSSLRLMVLLFMVAMIPLLTLRMARSKG